MRRKPTALPDLASISLSPLDISSHFTRKWAGTPKVLDRRAFRVGPETGPPPGNAYSTLAYGLFEPFVLKQIHK